MSSLIFYVQPNEAFVATDTLATHQNGDPFKFTSKAFLLPHLNMLIAGTGIAGLLSRWFIDINEHMVVYDIEALNVHTPSALNNLWRKFKMEIPIPDDMTTTVYHFGISKTTNQLHSYVYRSHNSFLSERLQNSLYVKPECNIPNNFELPRDLKQMMRSQREKQSLIPAQQRIHIGGEILTYHLNRSGCHIESFDKFEDYGQTNEKIFENFNSNKLTQQFFSGGKNDNS